MGWACPLVTSSALQRISIPKVSLWAGEQLKDHDCLSRHPFTNSYLAPALVQPLGPELEKMNLH